MKHLSYLFNSRQAFIQNSLTETRVKPAVYIVSGVWNSLPNSVVDACTVNTIKARLDKFWQHQAVKFDFAADLTGTESQSEEVIK